MYSSLTMTTIAKEKIGDSIAGLEITRIEVGSGTSTNPLTLTNVVTGWRTMDVADSFANVEDRSITASAVLTNVGLEVSMQMSEIGVFASKGGVEFLLAYSCNPEDKETIPSSYQEVGFVKNISVAIALELAVEGYPAFISGTGLVTYESMMLQINWLDNKKLDLIGGKISGDLEVVGDFTSRKTRNAVFCDYAELFEFFDKNREFKTNLIVGIDNTSPGEEYTYITSDSTPVGIISDTFGHLLGGPERSGIDDYDKTAFAPVGLSGRVFLWIEGPIRKGDKIAVSDTYSGYGVRARGRSSDIVGIALETVDREDIVNTKFSRIKVLIK